MIRSKERCTRTCEPKPSVHIMKKKKIAQICGNIIREIASGHT